MFVFCWETSSTWVESAEEAESREPNRIEFDSGLPSRKDSKRPLSQSFACVCRLNGTVGALDRGDKSGEEVGAYDVNDMGDIYINFYIK